MRVCRVLKKHTDNLWKQQWAPKWKKKDDNFVIFVHYFGSSMLQSIFFIYFFLVIFYTEIILRTKT